ncbi:hypothetical protein Tco_1123437 [Tanacetum coccineum]|uniref:Reverse transcriptase domain-containing protein n=1 Tax=Tanacetum coccineum TaxID=301880 RepID=A0ABQ5J662_9ASTR
MEDQPLPDDTSPTTLSSGYIADSDPEEDPKEYLEEDPADYHANGRDDADDESSNDDDVDNDDDDVEEVDDPIPSTKDTKAFEIDESAPIPVPSPTLCTARMFVRPQIPMSNTAEALIAEYASAPTLSSPPPSLLSLLSSPLTKIRSPPLPLPSPPTTNPTYDEASLGYRAVGIWLRAADMPLRKRARFTAPTGRFEVRESSSIVAASICAFESRAMTAIGEVNDRVTDLANTQRQDAQELYVRYEDAQDDRALLGAQAMEAQIRALQKDVDVLQRQRIRDEERLMAHIQYEHDRFRDLIRAVEAGPQDRPENGDSSCTNFQGVTDALAEIEANRTNRNGDDSHDSRTSSRRTKRAARECNYNDFVKCQPFNFKGTEGVVGLTQWFKRMESVFQISNCAVGNQIKFATCTLLGSALTWWNSYIKAFGHNAAYGMTWKSLMKMLTKKYCPRGEIKKLEIEI